MPKHCTCLVKGWKSSKFYGNFFHTLSIFENDHFIIIKMTFGLWIPEQDFQGLQNFRNNISRTKLFWTKFLKQDFRNEFLECMKYALEHIFLDQISEIYFPECIVYIPKWIFWRIPTWNKFSEKLSATYEIFCGKIFSEWILLAFSFLFFFSNTVTMVAARKVGAWCNEEYLSIFLILRVCTKNWWSAASNCQIVCIINGYFLLNDSPMDWNGPNPGFFASLFHYKNLIFQKIIICKSRYLLYLLFIHFFQGFFSLLNVFAVINFTLDWISYIIMVDNELVI